MLLVESRWGATISEKRYLRGLAGCDVENLNLHAVQVRGEHRCEKSRRLQSACTHEHCVRMRAHGHAGKQGT